MAPKRNQGNQWYCSAKICKTTACTSSEKPSMAFTPKLNKNLMQIKLGNQTVNCLLDTGAEISAISHHLLKQVAPEAQIRQSNLINIVGVCGERHSVLGLVDLNFECEGLSFRQSFHVFEHLHVKMIVGLDFLQKNNVTVRFGEVEIPVIGSLASGSTIKIATKPITSDHTSIVFPTEEVIVPPHSEVIIPVKISGFPNHSTVMLEPVLRLSDSSLAGSKSLSVVKNGRCVYRLMNPTNLPVFLKPNHRLAKASLIDPKSVYAFETDNQANVFSLNSDSKTDSQNYENILEELGINLDCADLSKEQKQKLINFLGRNREMFAKDMSEIGETNLHTHTIHTGDAKPVSTPPYRQTPKMRAELEKQLEEMERHGIIEESTSPWHSPVVMVRKPNNEWRFCVDYRKLNAVTETMSFPIPHMSDVFDTLAESKAEIFSTLDLRSGFWQVPLDKATKMKGAFITHNGVYEFNRLAFGMVNAPMTFQSLMTKVLKNLNFKIALVYIDDLLVFSKDFDQHLHHLDLVFSNLRKANLKLHPSKCKFATKQVKYLGHIVSKDGMSVNPENTEKIQNAKSPTNAKQVKSVLGMMGYYRKFVKNYAKIAAPLHDLLKKDKKFQWTEECETAFQELKSKLVTAPILRYPQFDKEFILSTDSSDFSIGYVLSQVHDGKELPVCYGGRALRNNELKWHITDKEGLALVEGIQHFRHYLANTKFTVYTDNVSVKYLQNIKDCQGRLGRWSILLQGYNFEIRHRPGSKNHTADYLSRQTYEAIFPKESSDLADHICSIQAPREYREVTLVYSDEDEGVVAAANEAAMFPADISFENLSEKQKACPAFVHLYQYLQNRQVPEDPLLARVIVAEAYNYELEDGVLKHFYSKRSRNVSAEERLVKQTVIPVILRDEYHDCLAGGGHQGFERTYAAIRNKYFWPHMYEDVRKYVKTCEICQQSKRAFGAKPPPLQPQAVDDVFSRWHMDILSGLPTTKEKYKHVLLVVDSYSKWCECFPLRTQEATEVAAVLFREIISRYGAPRVLISDRGKNFMSNLVKALSELFEIKRSYTSAYHPMTNGLVESKNSYILQALRAYCKGQQDDWPELLPGIMMAYRSTPATQSSDFSPFFLLYGREMRLPIDTVLQPKDHLAQDYKIHLGRVLQNLEVCRKLAGDNIKAAQDKYKYQHDKRSKLPSYQPAQRVWLYCTKVPPGKAPKLHRKWVGPYYITMLGPHHTYKLRNVHTNLEVKSLVNAARLKPYYDPDDRPTNPPDDLPDHEAELDPEEIIIPDEPQNQEALENGPPRAGPDSKQGTKPTKSNGPQRPQQNKDQTETKKQVPQKQGPKSGTNNPKVNKPQQTKMPTEQQIKQNKPVHHKQGPIPKTNKSKVDKPQIKLPEKQHMDQRSLMNKPNFPKQVDKKPARKQSNKNNTEGQREPDSNQPQWRNLVKQISKQQIKNKPKTLDVSKNINKTQQRSSSVTSKQQAKPSCNNKPAKQTESSAHRPQSAETSDKANRSSMPCCKDCLNKTCKQFSEKDIKTILASNRSNGALYYKVKFQDNSSNWYFPCKIPSHLIREFHTKRTMSGKKRKKPLKEKQHKFFTEAEPKISMATKEIIQEFPEPQIVALKIINGRSYYLVKNGNDKPQWQSICMAHVLVSDMLYRIMTEREDLLCRLKIQAAQQSINPPPPVRVPIFGAYYKDIHELELREDGNWYCLISFTKPEVPPKWVYLNGLPLETLDMFIELLSAEYETYVETDPYL